MLEFRPMRWSKLFIPTLRESPADAETVSLRWLTRAGFIRAVSSGVYGYLPLGQRSLARIQRLAREELTAAGGQEVTLPPKAAAEIARGELRSPKLLPQIWFRVETPLLRVRQFAGLEVHTFGDAAERVRAALVRILERCALPAVAVEGGLVLPLPEGPDAVVTCPACACRATPRTATSASAPPAMADPEGDRKPEEFHTPGQKTIADLAAFTGLPESAQMKSLVMVADGKPVLVLLRGDHRFSESKLMQKLGCAELRQAVPEELVQWMGAGAGSLGPIGVKGMPLLADAALAGRRNLICGANRDDYHLRHVTPGEDFEAEFCDLREVAPGDGCPRCGALLEFPACIDLARWRAGIDGGTFQLSLERILTASVELRNDADGIILPAAIAPFDVVVTAAARGEGAERVYRECLEAGLDAVLDDRDERAGVKFKDADLIGVPWRITVGKKLAEGLLELTERRTKQRGDVPVEGAQGWLGRLKEVL